MSYKHVNVRTLTGIRNILVKKLKSGKKKVTYGELSAELAKCDPPIVIRPRNLNIPLGALGDACGGKLHFENNRLPILPVVVVSKSNPNRLPGKGFFEKFAPHAKSEAEQRAFYENQIAAVIKDPDVYYDLKLNEDALKRWNRWDR